MTLQESGEMYLETILILTKKQGSVHAIDISKAMGFSKPSVSRAVNKLKMDKYIDINDKLEISLTNSGKEIANRIFERHQIITEMLIGIGVSPETASEDACRIEHVISKESFEAIKQHCPIDT